MFQEFLRIIPKLSSADTAAMEQSLNRRFSNVAKKFSKGLKAAVKGTVFGIGLAFLAELLNPLKELEDRIKDLLGKGEDINELADKYGSTPGALRTLQGAAALDGVNPEKLASLLESFSKTVDTATKEMEERRKDPTKTLSAASSAVSQFVGGTDRVDSFFRFLQGLQDFGKANGRAKRANVERDVFGEALYGNARRFIESPNLRENINKTGRSQEDINRGIGKLAELQRGRTARETLNETDTLIKASQKLNPGIVADIDRRAKKEEEKAIKQIDDYARLVKAAEALDGLASIVKEIKSVVIDALGVLRDIQGWLKNLLPSLPSLPGASIYQSAIGGLYNAIGLGNSSLMKKGGGK